jgi:hypothetical protein
MRPMSPTLSLILAQQRVADLLRSAGQERPTTRSQEEAIRRVGPAYRLRGVVAIQPARLIGPPASRPLRRR